MSKEYNQIVFTPEQFDNDVDKMYDAISKQIALLMKTENICVVYDDDTDIIVIEYEHNDRRDWWGCWQPTWLSPEEIDNINIMREEIPELPTTCGGIENESDES